MKAETETAEVEIMGTNPPTLGVESFGETSPSPTAGTDESGLLQDEVDILSMSSARAAQVPPQNIKSAPSEYSEQDKKDLKKDKTSTRSSSASNLIGHINNLVTTDLGNIVDARDFMFMFIFIPLQLVACITFLYWILGWRCAPFTYQFH
jgi:hypothetical protein